MHLIREIQLLELDVLEIVGHSKVHDQVHWLLGDDPLSDLDLWVRCQGGRVKGPASFPTCDPRDVSVVPVIRRAVPFHAVRVEVSARVLVNIVADPGKGTCGLLEVSTTVAVPFGDIGVVLLVIGGRVEWPIRGVERRQLQRLGHLSLGVFDVDLESCQSSSNGPTLELTCASIRSISGDDRPRHDPSDNCGPG